MISFTASHSATHSASELDNVMFLQAFDCQETVHLNTYKMKNANRRKTKCIPLLQMMMRMTQSNTEDTIHQKRHEKSRCWLLLDNQSTVDDVVHEKYLANIDTVDQPITAFCND